MREASLARIVGVLRARWWLILLLAIPVVLLGSWYASTRPPAYRSEVVLTLSPGTAGSPDNSFVRLVPRYVVAATSKSTLREAESTAGLPEGLLTDSVSAANPAGSLQIQLTATTEQADEASAAVGALAELLLAATEADPLVDAVIVRGPTDPRDITPLTQFVAVGAGVGLAFVPGVSLAFFLEGLRPRARTREDLEDLGLDVLLEVQGRHLPTLEKQARPRHSAVPTSLRLGLAAELVASGRGVVVLTSASASDATTVVRLAGLVADRAGDGDDAPRSPGGPGAAPVLLVLPDLLGHPAPQAAVREHRSCLLVVSAGIPMDTVRDCTRVLDRMAANPVGAVLVR